VFATSFAPLVGARDRACRSYRSESFVAGAALPAASARPGGVLGSASGSSRRALRRAVVVLALTPLTVLLATRLHNLTIDPLLGLYAVMTLATLTGVLYLAFVRYSDPSQDPPVVYGQPLVSCLVAVKNEREVIERCLESLLGSSYPNLELIAIDDGSDDGTTEIMQRIAAAEPRLRVLYNAESVGKKRALVRAAAEARGAFFVFTDSDCVMGHDAIERVMVMLALVAGAEATVRTGGEPAALYRRDREGFALRRVGSARHGARVGTVAGDSHPTHPLPVSPEHGRRRHLGLSKPMQADWPRLARY
jgi:hypothetical protein